MTLKQLLIDMAEREEVPPQEFYDDLHHVFDETCSSPTCKGSMIVGKLAVVYLLEHLGYGVIHEPWALLSVSKGLLYGRVHNLRIIVPIDDISKAKIEVTESMFNPQAIALIAVLYNGDIRRISA